MPHHFHVQQHGCFDWLKFYYITLLSEHDLIWTKLPSTTNGCWKIDKVNTFEIHLQVLNYFQALNYDKVRCIWSNEHWKAISVLNGHWIMRNTLCAYRLLPRYCLHSSKRISVELCILLRCFECARIGWIGHILLILNERFWMVRIDDRIWINIIRNNI